MDIKWTRGRNVQYLPHNLLMRQSFPIFRSLPLILLATRHDKAQTHGAQDVYRTINAYHSGDRPRPPVEMKRMIRRI